MKKLQKKSELILYAISGMGINMLNLMMASYLCSALLIGGFGETAIPYQTYLQKDLILPAVWAVFALLAKILDGVIDIPMAAFTDNLKSKWGRRRPAILLGLVVTVISYLLFLLVPNASGATLGNTIYYGVVLCVFYCFYTLTMVTYYATFTEIVDTTEKRNILSNVKSVCDVAYFILGYVAVRILLNGVNIRKVALIVLPIALTMIIPLFMIKEHSTLAGEAECEVPVNLMQSLVFTLKNKTFILWMLTFSFMTFSVQLFLGGINEYFSFVGMNMILIMMSAFAPVPLTLLLFRFLIRKYGFGFAFRYVLVIFCVSMTSMGLIGFMAAGTLKSVLAILSGLIASFAVGAMFSVAYSVPAQLAAEEEEKTGIGNSAMYFAVQGLFAGVASGIATGVVLTALKGSQNHPTDAIKYMTLIAAAGCLLSLLVSKTLPESVVQMGRNGETKDA